jgi:hypothetical protein
MTDQHPKVIYIVGGQKGGVGKTSTCQALCQYRIDNHEKGSFTLIEGDAQIDDVGRAYGDQIQGTQKVVISDDRAKRSNPDVIYDTAINADKDVIVNLPSNILDVFGRWLEEGQVIRILQEKLKGQVRLVKLFVSDGCHESIHQLEKSVNMLDNSIPHVLILNEGRVSAADFSYLDKEEMYTKLRSAPNLIDVFKLPALEPGTRFFVDKYGQGLRKAYEQSEADSDFIVAHRIESFIQEVHDLFKQVDESIDKWFAQQPEWSNGSASTSKGSSSKDSEAKSEGGEPKKPKSTRKKRSEPVAS